MPADISSDTKHGIDFTPLPGQEFAKLDPTIPRFSFLPGEGSQSDGTVGIDYAAAMDMNSMRNNKSEGMDIAIQRLQHMRGADEDRIKAQAENSMMYMQNGPMGMGGNKVLDLECQLVWEVVWEVACNLVWEECKV